MSSHAAAQWQHTNGLNGERVNALSVKGTYLFAGTRDSGVFRSGDNGMSWLAVNTGLTNLTIRALAIKGIYLFAGTQDSGVFRSGDNGASWLAVNTGISSTNIQALAANDTFLFAGTSGGGVCRSSDYGMQWLAVNKLEDGTDLHFLNIYSFAVTHTYLFIGTWGGSAFRSADNGTIWYMVTNGMADPRENQIPYSFAVGDTFIFAGMGGGGVLRAKDSARVWFPVNVGLPDSAFVTALALSNDTLFAATQKGVFRSIDDGDNWLADNNGLTDTLIFSFAKSETNLFAGTNNGVWRLPMFEPPVKAEPIVGAGSGTRSIKLVCSSPSIINYSMGSAQKGNISVYASSGKRLFSKEVCGEGKVAWNSLHRSSGIYIARLQVGAMLSTITMVLPE